MSEKKNNSIYCDPHPLESFNSLFNFIVGDRGRGKTFRHSKLRPISRFLETGEQFIYLRRYKNELKTLDIFFDDVREFFPDVELKVKNRVFYCNGKVMGFAINLSTANMLKSTAYPKVQTIVFDEFILEKGYIRYLDSEVRAFLNFYETVARDREDVKVYFLGNSVSLVNPYFIHWKIMPNTKQQFTKVRKTLRDGRKGRHLIVVEIMQDDSDEGENSFRQNKINTDYGELINGSEFGEMSIHNNFADDNTDFIEKKTANARFLFNLVYKGVIYGIWLDASVGKWFVSMKRDKQTVRTYAITTDDFKVNMFLVDNLNSHNGLKMVVKAFTNGYLMFENNQIKSEMLDVMKLLGC